MEFVKHDENKAPLDFLGDFADEVSEVCRVLDYGARKYGRSNWKRGSSGRYVAALLRHVFAYAKGEHLDPDTGLSHLAHAAANCLILMGLHRKQQEPKNDAIILVPAGKTRDQAYREYVEKIRHTPYQGDERFFTANAVVSPDSYVVGDYVFSGSPHGDEKSDGQARCGLATCH